MPTAVSLFIGCGGSDAGIIAAGFDVLMANDLLAYAADVYEANLPATDYKRCPVEEIESFPAADLLVGCYPCQGRLSPSGRLESHNVDLRRAIARFPKVMGDLDLEPGMRAGTERL